MRSLLLPTLFLPLLLVGQRPVPLAYLPAPLRETSGLLMVEDQVWSHADSGNPNSLYRIDATTGEILQEVELTNATNVDWEAITTDGQWVYVGDFGNNLGDRRDLSIYRFALQLLRDSSLRSVEVDTIRFTYAEQEAFTPANMATRFDCEAFIAWNDSLYLFTKDWVDFRTAVHALPAVPGSHQARLRGRFDVQGLVTDATWVRDTLVLLGYAGMLQPFLWTFAGPSPGAFFPGRALRTDLLLPLTQMEAVAWAGGDSLLLSNEGDRFGPARLWGMTLPAFPPLEEALAIGPEGRRSKVYHASGEAKAVVLDSLGAILHEVPIDVDGSLLLDAMTMGSYLLEVRDGAQVVRVSIVLPD